MSALLKTLQFLRVAIIDDPHHQIGRRTDQLIPHIRQANFEARWEMIQSETTLADKMASPPDLILVPFQASPLNACQVLQIVSESGAAVPVIVIDNAIGEEAVVTIMRQGAADFVRWDRLERFTDAVRGTQNHLSIQRLLESVGEISYVYQIAPEPKLIYISPAIQAITGYSTQAFYRDPDLLQHFLPIKQIKLMAHANTSASLNASGTFHPTLVSFQRPNADRICLEHHIIPILDPTGQWLLHGIARDVTERERVNEALRCQTGYMVALQETALTLMDNHDHYQLLETILVQAKRLTNTEHGSIYLKEPGETVMRMRIASGVFARFIGDEAPNHDESIGTTGQSIQTGHVVTISNYSMWPGRVTNPELEPIQAAISVPLKLDEQIVGVLSLAYIEPGRSFGNAEIDLLGHFAALTSVALKNSRLVSDVNRELAERRRIEQLLKEREERLQLVLEGSNDGFWDWDVQTGKMEVSTRWAEMLGYTPAEVEPNIQFWEKLLHPDDSAAVHQKLSAHLAGMTANYEAEIRTLTRTGEWKWILTRGKVAASDAEGKPLRMAGTHTDISERKRAEEAVHANTQLYRQMFETNQTVKLLVDPNTSAIVDANSAAASYYGYKLSVLKTMKITDINTLAPSIIHADMQQAAQTDRKIFKFKHRLASGEIRDVEVYSGPIDHEGKRLLYSIIIDVTQREVAENLLRASEIRNLAILNAIPDLMFRQNREGVYLDYWSNAPDTLYIPPETFLGHKVKDVMPSEFSDLAMNYIQKTLDTNTLQVFEYQLAISGVPRHFECRMVVCAPDEVLSLIRDITEKKNAQQHEKEVINNVRGVLEMADELISTQDIDLFYRRAVELPREKLGVERCAIFLLDPTRQFLVGTYGTNEQGEITDERLAKFSAQRNPELLTRFDGPWWVTQNGVLTAWDGNEIKDVGTGWIATTLIRTGDDPIGIFSNDAALTGAPLSAIQQESISLYCSLLGHVIERKRNEETLRESLQHEQELSELRARFVTTVSHEFRTPLATILATADALRHYLPKMTEIQKTERFNKIETQVRHMIALLNDVLIVGEIEEGSVEIHREWFDLNYLFREMTEDFSQSTTDYTLQYIGTMEPAAIMADRKLIRQMVTNLLSNAAKYSPIGSTIVFTLTHDPKHVFFSVKDQGIGIPEADLQKLFTAFQRGTNVGNVSGTGLGLSIVKHSVDAHSGTIKVDSVLTTGTTFTITLPIDSAN